MSKYYFQLIGSVTAVAISILDYFVVIDLSLSILYLLPISITSWYGKKWLAIFLALMSTVGWFIAESAAKSDLYVLVLLWNTAVRLIVFLTIALLLSNLKIAYEKEKSFSQTDGLTGIANYRFFRELLRLECKRSLRSSHHLTLAYFDLDNFKQVNDRFGHNTGDKLLKIVAQTIQKHIRETDTIARLGGDEFALLLPETNYEAAQSVLHRLQHKLAIAIEAYVPPVSFSIGAVTFLSLPDSIEAIISHADSLMYEVKKNGKNRLEHQIFDTSNNSI